MSRASPLAPTVLVVEDDPLAVEETRAALAFIPEVDVLVAATLEAARALVRRHRILLAIVDLGLPDGDGLALIAELTRATAAHHASPRSRAAP